MILHAIEDWKIRKRYKEGWNVNSSDFFPHNKWKYPVEGWFCPTTSSGSGTALQNCVEPVPKTMLTIFFLLDRVTHGCFKTCTRFHLSSIRKCQTWKLSAGGRHWICQCKHHSCENLHLIIKILFDCKSLEHCQGTYFVLEYLPDICPRVCIKKFCPSGSIFGDTPWGFNRTWYIQIFDWDICFCQRNLLDNFFGTNFISGFASGGDRWENRSILRGTGGVKRNFRLAH